MWPYVLIGVAAAAVIAGVVYVILRNRKISQNGIEAEAVVSRIKEIENTDENGHVDFRYEYYVKYTNQEGQTVEAKLSSAPHRTREGDKLRIKYLPEKPKYVIPVKE